MPSYSFNPKNRSYYNERNKLIPRDRIRGWIREANEAERKRLAKIGNDFKSGIINRSEAELRAIAEITKHNSAVAVIANGGREQMSAKAWGRAGATAVKPERAFLRELFLSYDRGDVTKEKLASRLENYGDAAGRHYESLFRDYAKDAGLKKEKNVSGSGKPCSECPGLSAMGEVNIGTLPPCGARACGPACNCAILVKGVDY